jgi:HD-like signal output (HDOD) protein
MNDFKLNRESYLKKIKAYIVRMPSLSTTLVKVLETCNDPLASANDLKRVISLDPVLTGRVLRLINSAYYSLGKPISSLTRAIIMLGVNTVKNLALSFTVLDNLNRKSSCQSFSADEFWRHSLCVGVVAKSLAALKGLTATGQEEYFVAGLLHDLGKLPLYIQFPEEYYRICNNVDGGQTALYQDEARFLGVDHGAVGRIIAKKWRLGSTLVESLSCHHNSADRSDENCEFVSTVELANQLSIHFNIGNAGDQFIDHRRMSLLRHELGVGSKMLAKIQDTVPDEIERAKFFLEVVRSG